MLISKAMSLPRRIFFNTLVQTVGKIFALAVGITTLGLLSQYLQEKGFGQYSTVFAYLSLFVVFADFGLYLYVVREISRPAGDHPEGEKARNKKILSNALGLRLVIALASLSLGALLALLFPYEGIVKQTMFVGVVVFLLPALNQVLVGVFQKHLVQHLVVFAETAGRIVNLALVYLFVRRGLPLPYFIFALGAGNAMTFFLSLVFAKRYEKFGIAFDVSYWKKIIAVSWPLAFSVILNLIYFKTDTVILSLFRSQQEVGIYSLAYKILETLIVFPGMFVGLILPLLSRTAFTNWQEFRTIFQRAFDVLLLTSILVIVSTSFFANKIIDLVRGDTAYHDSPAILQILILAAGIIFLGTLFGYAVVAVNKQLAMVKGYLLGALVGLMLYFILIPRFGYWGAAWGTVMTEVIVATYAYSIVKKTSGAGLSLKILIPALPAIILLVLFFAFVSLPWILEICLGVAIYTACLLVGKAIPLKVVKDVLFLQ